jgi:tRNA U55 pseudouridine synthase TruB
MSDLRRTTVGAFSLDDALQVKLLTAETLADVLLTI